MAKKRTRNVAHENMAPQQENQRLYTLSQMCNHFHISGITRMTLYNMLPESPGRTIDEWKNFLLKNGFNFRNC